ncbi:hypothetical protein E2562_021937 [Oryza meyeriana var. granulata]|uniref:Uncharacterized protein n=1 Tax=Oryza meyeriana var. granulata TaxID=110450 RepID=A0A6G1DKC8_9ORYZ|nr:hypothetical protein E2562_021937 [Oryza meyeriana var. granulata]
MDQLSNLLKSAFESPEFFQKVDEIQKSLYQNDAVLKSLILLFPALKKTFSAQKRKASTTIKQFLRIRVD